MLEATEAGLVGHPNGEGDKDQLVGSFSVYEMGIYSVAGGKSDESRKHEPIVWSTRAYEGASTQ